MTGVSCDPGGSATAQCPAGSQTYTCYQCIDQSSTPTTPPSTPTPTATPPATPPPPTTGVCPQITAGGSPGAGGNCDSGAPNQNIGTCTSNKCATAPQGVPGHTISVCQFNSSANRLCYYNDNQCWPDSPCPTATVAPQACPGSGIPGTPHSGNTQDWGGSCQGQGLNKSVAVAIPGTCSCTVAQCETYSGGPLCWVNNGQTYNDPLGCSKQGASLAASCFASASASPSTCSPSNCTLSGGNICNTSNLCVSVPNQIQCSTKPTCSSDHTLFQFPNNMWSCSNTNNPATNSNFDQAPSCANVATVTFTVGLDGIGNTPDRQSAPNANASNKNPLHTSRNLITYVTDSTGKVTHGSAATLNYSSGVFTGTATFAIPQTGSYSVTVQTDGFIADATSANLTLGSNTNVTIDHLINGDINHDGHINLLDYAFFSPGNCLFKSATGACASADLNDDGTVDQFDYNLWLREFRYSSTVGL